MDTVIKALDFAGNAELWAFNDIDMLRVRVVSGDELIEVYKDGRCTFEIDAGKDSRLVNYYDGSYTVRKDQINEWMKREDSYEWLIKLEQ